MSGTHPIYSTCNCTVTSKNLNHRKDQRCRIKCCHHYIKRRIHAILHCLSGRSHVTLLISIGILPAILLTILPLLAILILLTVLLPTILPLLAILILLAVLLPAILPLLTILMLLTVLSLLAILILIAVLLLAILLLILILTAVLLLAILLLILILTAVIFFHTHPLLFCRIFICVHYSMETAVFSIPSENFFDKFNKTAAMPSGTAAESISPDILFYFAGLGLELPT